MRLDFAGVFADALTLWRKESDLLVRIAGVFFFLPAYAFRLFVPVPQPAPEAGEATAEAAFAQMVQWFTANAHWLLAERLVELFGGAVLFALLLAERRPTAGEAMAAALRRLPVYVLVYAAAMALIAAGWMIFILPGLYLLGRTFLTGAVVMAEPGRGPGDALLRAFRLTQGNGWLLLLATMVIFSVGYFGAVLIGELYLGLGLEGFVGDAVRALLDALGATIAAAVALAMVLVQTAAYRRLSESRPKHGI